MSGTTSAQLNFNVNLVGNGSKDVFLAVVAVNQADMVLPATTCGAVIAGVRC